MSTPEHRWEHGHENHAERDDESGWLWASDGDEAASGAETDRPAIEDVQPNVSDKDDSKQ